MKRFITITLMSLLVSLAWAQWDGTVATGFARGDGSEATPFEIETAAQLAYLAEYMEVDLGDFKFGGLGQFFKLMNDIDLSGGHSWLPIGSFYTPFQGSFDGNGHIIRNMKVTVSSDYTPNTRLDNGYGLFGNSKLAVIKNLGITSYSITGENINYQGIGALCGRDLGSNIEVCYTIGNIDLTSLTGANKIGGFIGRAQKTGQYDYPANTPTTISNCYTRSDITVTGIVSEISEFAGSTDGGNYTACYAYNPIMDIPAGAGASSAFSGYAQGTFIDCFMNETSNPYIAGGVTKTTEADFKSQAMVIKLDASAWRYDSDATLNDGFPVLAWQGGGEVTPVFVRAASSAPEKGNVEGAGQYAPGETAVVRATAHYGFTFKNWDNTSYGESNVLVIENIQSTVYLMAYFEESAITATPNWNESTITSVNDLMAFSNAVNAGNDFAGKTVTLDADLTLDKTMNWQPIGNTTTNFAGIFDGNGHIISDLYINKSDMYQGLFGVVSGTIKNVGVDNAFVKANNRSGILVGHLTGSSALVESSFVTGEFSIFSGGSDVGGLAGRIENGATLQNCYSKAIVYGTGGGTGGVAGTLEANSYVTSCYSVGAISSPDYSPAIVGYIAGTIENSFFDSETTGVSVAVTGATAATSAEMKTQVMVDNLNNSPSTGAWHYNANVDTNGGYPVLSWQQEVTTDIKKAEQAQLNVFATNGYVHVQNAEVGQSVSVISLTGAVHRILTVNTQSMTIALPKGIWIITHGSEARKVIVN